MDSSSPREAQAPTEVADPANLQAAQALRIALPSGQLVGRQPVAAPEAAK